MKNKEQTKRNLILAVGELIKKNGFENLKITGIAKEAGVDKKLIYRYFGSFNNLVEAYVVENDYWLIFFEKLKNLLAVEEETGTKQFFKALLQNQFKYFFAEKDMQRLILWELTTGSPMMKSIHNARELRGQQVLELTDEHFKDSTVNFRAITALLVGGIYYTILHTISNGGTFADIDIRTDNGKDEMIKSIGQIIDWAYEKANKNEE